MMTAQKHDEAEELQQQLRLWSAAPLGRGLTNMNHGVHKNIIFHPRPDFRSAGWASKQWGWGLLRGGKEETERPHHAFQVVFASGADGRPSNTHSDV